MILGMHRLFAVVIVISLVLQAGTTHCCEGCNDLAICTMAAACKACSAQALVPAEIVVPPVRQAAPYVPSPITWAQLQSGDIWRPPPGRHQ